MKNSVSSLVLALLLGLSAPAGAMGVSLGSSHSSNAAVSGGGAAVRADTNLGIDAGVGGSRGNDHHETRRERAGSDREAYRDARAREEEKYRDRKESQADFRRERMEREGDRRRNRSSVDTNANINTNVDVLNTQTRVRSSVNSSSGFNR